MPTERQITVDAEAAGRRLDHFLVEQLGVSRARVQWLIEEGKALVDSKPAKSSLKLRGGESVDVTGEAEPRPLRAQAEDIAIEIVYEDEALAVVNKPAGMMVHAGAGVAEDENGEDLRNKGTLVNALLHHFTQLSAGTTGRDGEGEEAPSLRPGIVHRLDKQTSGLIIVAKNDRAHAALAEMFAARRVEKTYLALVGGEVKAKSGTINAPISRDSIRRTRMTTRGYEGRTAISHYKVLRRIESPFGRFTLVSVRIETGRTHQIRVHLSSIGHPVVGDTLYGAPAKIPMLPLPGTQGQATRRKSRAAEPVTIALDRNFLHAAELAFPHPETGERLEFASELPVELQEFLAQLSAPRDNASKG